MTAVATVVLASRCGARLAASLEGAVGERLVLDPAGKATSALPGGVRCARTLGELSTGTAAPWLLLLHEGERASRELAGAVEDVTTRPSADAYRVPLEVRAFGTRLHVRGAPVRLARRELARVRVRPGLVVEFVPGRAPQRLAQHITFEAVSSLTDAVADIDAEASTLAALLLEGGIRPTLRRMMLAPLVAGGRMATSRAAARLGWGRWVLAVLAGYRTVAAYAKLWELRASEPPP
jgi:hypothetical protein